ncbi:MAG: helix-turn-helix domain-containing protein [Chloroflexota bacterium]|nr:helix-turn-helix domain-containing protein [Chloroflexota bacterium]
MGQGRKKVWDKEKVHSLRIHLGVTQVELAQELGVRQQTISDWEQGIYQPRGASSTLLSIIAERSDFKYKADKE